MIAYSSFRDKAMKANLGYTQLLHLDEPNPSKGLRWTDLDQDWVKST